MAKSVAVVIGINYTHFPNPLRFAEDDAKAMATILRDAQYDVVELLGIDATRAMIIKVIEQKGEVVSNNDLLLVYFAGHGAIDHKKRAYLLPTDTDLEWLAANAIPLEDLSQRHLKGIPTALILLDCCHSGYAVGMRDGTADSARGRAQFLNQTNESFRQEYGQVVLAACAGEQTARELAQLGHGAFTYYFLEHWQTNTDEVEVGTLFRDIALGLEGLKLPPPVRGGGQVGRLVVRQALDAHATPTSVGTRSILYAKISSLDETHWHALLTDLEVDPQMVTGSHPNQISKLILHWFKIDLLNALEDAVQIQVERQGVAQQIVDVTRQIAELDSQITSAKAQEDWDKVIKVGESLLKLNGQHQNARTETALAYYRRGDLHREQRHYEKALINYTHALKIDPTLAVAHNGRGIIHETQQLYNEALDDYTHAIEVNPTMAVAYNNRGNVYYTQHRYAEALADFDRVIEIEPNGDRYYNRGQTFYKQQRYTEALADYTRAIEFDPSDAEAYFYRGTIYDLQNIYEQALNDYTQAIKHNPNYAHAYYMRSEIYHVLELEDQANTDRARAHELDPSRF